MKKSVIPFQRIAINICLFLITQSTQSQNLSIPQQDKGLPYTRSARAHAMEALKNYTAIFAGSKYGYVNGFKVRLDDKDILRGDAVLQYWQSIFMFPAWSLCEKFIGCSGA